jgi:hypothetical protein
LQPVYELLAALSTGADSSELAAEARARATFRAAVNSSDASRRRRRRTPSVLTSLLSAKLAVAIAAGTVGIGGVVAAAYTGSLPHSAQGFAHHTIGAPAASANRAHEHRTASAQPVGPDATREAAFGLCTAYMNAKAHGSASEHAVAFGNLATAAGGASNIEAYCAAAAPPGTSPAAVPGHAAGKPTSHPTGKPTSHPTGKPTSHPTGKPTSHPTGKPTSHPTGKPTDKPGASPRP